MHNRPVKTAVDAAAGRSVDFRTRHVASRVVETETGGYVSRVPPILTTCHYLCDWLDVIVYVNYKINLLHNFFRCVHRIVIFTYFFSLKKLSNPKSPGPSLKWRARGGENSIFPFPPPSRGTCWIRLRCDTRGTRLPLSTACPAVSADEHIVPNVTSPCAWLTCPSRVTPGAYPVDNVLRENYV